MNDLHERDSDADRDAPIGSDRDRDPVNDHADDSASVDASLRHALRARFGRQPLVPPAADDAVLERASVHFAAIRRARTRQRWRVAGAGIAAAAMLAVSMWVFGPLTFGPAAPSEHAQGPARVPGRVPGDIPGVPGVPGAGDVNGDGVVDVLDMLVLARTLEAGAEPPSHADMTGDGQVTVEDVHALGKQVVALPPTEEEPRS